MDVPTSENDCTYQKPASATYKEVNIDDAIEEHNKGISRAAYIELHRAQSNKLTNNLKKKYERQTSDEKQQIGPRKKDSKTRIPIPKPRSLQVSKTKLSNSKSKISLPLRKKDENANDVIRKRSSSSEEYITIVLRSESEESLDKVNKELNLFTMDKHPKEKKKSSSFRRILTGKIFTKEKKKKEEEKPTSPPHKENVSLNDNIKNESNDFNRQSNLRHTISSNDPNELRQSRLITKKIEDKYAQMHIREFNQIKNNFENHRTPEKPARSNGPGSIVYRRFEPKYTDVSSSASTLTSDGTFGENVSTNPELKLIRSNAIIPINSERPLANPYQFGRNSEEVYSQEHHSTANSDIKLKKSPSIELSKLKLPPNRDVATLSRVRSPISHDFNNTDKEIATELLKPKRSPTPNQNLKSLSPTRKAFASSEDYPESLRHLSLSQQNSSSSVEYRDNIFEDRQSESFPQSRQRFSPIVNRDGIYEKMVNEALTPAHDEDKRGSFSALNNFHEKRATQSPSPAHIENRRSESLSPPVQRYPSSSDKENSYEKRMIGHLSPSRRMFLSLNASKKSREDMRNNSGSPHDQAPFHSANQDQLSRKNANASPSPTRSMFPSLNSKRGNPCDDRGNYSGAPISPADQDQSYRRNAYGSLSIPSSSSPAHQTSLDYPDNVEQNNANRDLEPHYSSRFQNRQNQSISRNVSPQYLFSVQKKERPNIDRDERSSSPAESQSNSRTSDQDLWKTRQTTEYATIHSSESHHSFPSSSHERQTLERPEAREVDVQRRKMKLTEPGSRNAVPVKQNLSRYPETEEDISKHSPENQNISRNSDFMTNHPASETRVNPAMHRNTQGLSNQRLMHLAEDDQVLRHRINPNEFRHTYDNNQNKCIKSEDPMNSMSGETRQNRDIYPPRNMMHNLQSEEQSSRHQINEIKQHRNIPSQNLRHSPQSGQHQLIRNIPPPQDVRHRLPEPQRQVFFPPESPNYGVYKNVPPPANLIRSSTPNNLAQSPLKPVSPQKEDLRRSVEAYYWKEIKKLKEQENLELYYYQMNMAPYMGYAEDPGSLRRSRSLLPTSDRNSRRSLSLPRNVPNDSSSEPVMMRQHPVPQHKAVIYQNEPLYGQHFKRNTPERRTIDGSNRNNSIYRPIFKRGSLTTPVKQQDDPQYKKVSFRHFEESAPRRQAGHNSSGQRNNAQYPLRYSMNVNDGVYGNPNEIYPRYVPQIQQNRWPNIPEQEVQHAAPRAVTRHGSIQLQEGIYDRRPPLARKPSYDSNFARRGAEMPKREVIMGDNEIFGQFGGYLPKEPSYSGSVISTQESIYGQSRGPKQTIVSDKVCDMYGQIHDRNSPSVVRKSGVMIGRLQQQPPQAPTPQPVETPDFLQRNSRLTSSATDMLSGRYPNRAQQQNPHVVYKEGIYSDYPPSRPLPPVPISARNSPKYDTSKGAKEHRSRSGSAGNCVNLKKKGLFGTKNKESSLEHLETEKSRQLSTTELQRLVLLEQLHLIRLQSQLEAEKLS